MINKEEHDKISKDYAEKRKKKKSFYYRLLFSSGFAIVLLIIDFVLGIIPNIFKILFLIILFILSYIFYRKWRYLTTKKIITAQLSTGQILVGSEKVKFRIGGDRFMDKIKKFFKIKKRK